MLKKKVVYEVYVCIYNDEVLYVGHGKLGRHFHCNSGTSHVYELNKIHFSDKENIFVRVVRNFEDKNDAMVEEMRLIKNLKPKFNCVGQNFRELSKEYYELSEKLKSCNFTCRDTVEKMEKLLSADKELKSFVETIGIDAIKATGFHKTKCKAKFNKAVGVDEKSIKQLKVIKSVKLKVNSFYTFAELRDKLIIAYSDAKLSCTAKATDIQHCYVVKKTARNKVQGFLIVDKV